MEQPDLDHTKCGICGHILRRHIMVDGGTHRCVDCMTDPDQTKRDNAVHHFTRAQE